jgi:hypothetical protein
VTRRRTDAAAALGYAAVSFLYFGLRVLPHPGRELIGFGGDPQIFVWSLGWWPHAVLHGDNPFLTHAVWAPEGVNLAWTTSVPGLALLFAPVTLAFGPVVAYNLAAVLLPAAAASTAYLLCRHLTGAFWPSLAGGYVFGFSAYMLGQQLGHMHMTAVFLMPLVALVVLRFVEGELTGRGLSWRLGALLGFQAWLSTELLLTVTTALVVALVVAFATVRALRPRLVALLRPLLGAALVAALVAGPLLAYAAGHFESKSINRPRDFDADLLNFAVPTRLMQVARHWAPGIADHFLGNDAERGAYLGLPLLAIVVWFAVRERHRPGARFLVAAFALAAVSSLGTSLRVEGHRVVTLPWAAVAAVPPFNNVLPVRLSLFTSLAVAAIFALWLRRTGGWAAAVLAVLAVAAILPTVRLGIWSTTPQRVAFFSDGLYRTCLAPDDVVFVVPFAGAGDSTLWQAEAGYDFAMAGGYLRPAPPWSYLRYPAVGILHFEGSPPPSADLRQLFAAKGVTRVVVTREAAREWRASLGWLGSPRSIGGVLVYPGCAARPASTRGPTGAGRAGRADRGGPAARSTDPA